MSKKKIKFLYDAYVNKELFAHKGEIKEVELESGSFVRWLKRGHEEYKEEQEEKQKKPLKRGRKPKQQKEQNKEDEDVGLFDSIE